MKTISNRNQCKIIKVNVMQTDKRKHKENRNKIDVKLTESIILNEICIHIIQ